MRIEEISVDGFGLLHGRSLTPAPGLTLVRGLNEAGKTTLLGFVRAILFGFEQKRYAAMAGGRRGGRLTVRMADGRLMKIERYGERGGQGTLKVIDEDGVDRGPDELGRLLQNVDAPLFRNVFAFGLAELAAFENLQAKEVSARIYGAGLGLGSVSAVDTEKALASRAADLFKPGGSTPPINQLLRELEEVDERLKSRDLPAEHADTVQRLTGAEAARDANAERLRSVGEELRGHERHRKAWSAWIDLRDATAARERVGAVALLPRDLPEALVRLETRATETADRLTSAGEALARQAEIAARIAPDPAVLAQRDALAELAGNAIRDRERQRELESVSRDIDAADREVAAALGRLGAGWAEAQVTAFDDSLGVETAITGRFRDLLDRATDAASGAEAVAAEITRGMASLDADLATIEEQVTAIRAEEAALPPVDQAERRLRGLESATALRDGADDAVARAEEAAAAAERAVPSSPAGLFWADLARDAASLREVLAQEELLASIAALSATGAGTGAAAAPVPVAALGVGLVAVVGAAVVAALGSPLIAAGVLAVGLIVAAVLWLRARQAAATGAGTRSGDPGEERLAVLRERHAALAARAGLAPDAGVATVADHLARCTAALRLADEADALHRSADRAIEQATAARTAMEAAARAAGLPDQPTRADLDAAAQRLAQARERAARRLGLVAQAETLRLRREGRTRELEAARVRVTEADAALTAALGEWREWLAQHGLDDSLDRETAARMVAAVTAAKQPMRTRVASRARAAELQREHEAFVRAARALAAEVGRPAADVRPGDQPALEGLLADLERARATAVGAAAQRDEALRTLTGLEAASRAAADAHAAATAALDGLLGAHGAADPGALREQIAVAGDACRLDAVIDGALTSLRMLSGPGAALERLREELAAIGDVSESETAYAERTVELDDLEEEQAGLYERIGELRDAVERMEQDAAGAADRQRKEDLLGRLEAQARAWSVLSVARHVLARSRSAYEAEHRPAVLKTAEAYFREWTGGRYARILAPAGSTVEAVEHRDGTSVAIEDLSTGTAQQLYLAIRFGLLEHFARNAEPLPIVMDDILVNFDNERAQLAARSIEQLASRQQVLYFTCHPEVPLNADVHLELPRLRTVADALGGVAAGTR